ncbi:unnamed protein product [Rhodiola kirilowii]
MAAPAMETVPVEPQSLKKLSFKSLKRALDFFAPIHDHLAPPDPESKKIRISHKVNVEYGGIKGASTGQAPNQMKSGVQDVSGQTSAPSNALALPGPEKNHVQQMGGASSALVVGPTIQPKLNVDGQPGRSNAVVSTPSPSSERNLSTAAIMERIPSRWPRPDWHAPWKNYRV